MDEYIILPSSSDLNRGDQALIWETVKAAKNAGYKGDYFMLSNHKDLTNQSQDKGLKVLSPMLKHPSRKFESKNNTEYNKRLIFKWGLVAFFDLLFSLLLLNKFTRKLIEPSLSEENKITLNKIKNSKACFVKGGGFIHSYGDVTDLYKMYFHLYHLILAQSLNKPVYIMPNSFGPFKAKGVAWLVNKVLKKCELVTARESKSKKMLKQIGINSKVFPDLGFGLKKSSRKNIEFDKVAKQFPERKLVAITVRPYRFPGSKNPSQKYQNYINGMIKFAKWLYENKYLPVFIEHTLSVNEHENDGTSIKEIVSELEDNKYKIISNKNLNCKELKSIYSEFDFVVGTRFHSVIFSLSELVPAIAITYGGNKGQGIMQDLNLAEYAISIRKFDFKKLINKFNNLIVNERKVIKLLDQEKVRINKELSDLILIMKYYKEKEG